MLKYAPPILENALEPWFCTKLVGISPINLEGEVDNTEWSSRGTWYRLKYACFFEHLTHWSTRLHIWHLSEACTRSVQHMRVHATTYFIEFGETSMAACAFLEGTSALRIMSLHVIRKFWQSRLCRQALLKRKLKTQKAAYYSNLDEDLEDI